LPEVGNGHLARKVKGPSIFAAGLYNGDAHGSTGQASHRARIPPYNVWVRMDENHKEVWKPGGYGEALDVEQATYLSRTHDPPGAKGVQVDQRWYAPLQEPTMLVHEIELWNRGEEEKKVDMRQWGDKTSWSFNADLAPKETVEKFGFTRSNTHAVAGETKAAEINNKTSFALVANRAPEFVKLLPHRRETIYAITVVVTTLNSTDPLASALRTLSQFTRNNFAAARKLHGEHVAAWRRRWDYGRIEVSGDLALAQVVNSSLYYIRSSIRHDWPHGLSPGGLSSDGYSGHSFWDMETWMYPPLLMLEPESAKTVLQYRFDRREHAKRKARECGNLHQSYCPPGYQSKVAPEAMMFPWESAHTGADVQYWGGRLGPWGRFEQHITGDISFAAQQYWYVSKDRDWLRHVGMPLVNGSASFYFARLEYMKRDGDSFNYRKVMGPDEYSWPVDNSGYTNAVARKALLFAYEAAYELGFTGHPYWDFQYRAEKLYIPFTWGVPGMPQRPGGFHPEYEGFPKPGRRPQAKQADTILLAYPLGVSTNRETNLNDLMYYERITDPSGPAMTWSVFAINWFGAKNYQKSTGHFRKGFANAQAPFGVWTEFPSSAPNYPGCINFITGAGGFLQSLVYGTSGMRIKKDWLEFDPPPPRATGTYAWKLTLHSFHYRGWRLRQEVMEHKATYKLLGGSGPRLCLGTRGEMRIGRVYTWPREKKLKIRPCKPVRAAVRKRRLQNERHDIFV